MALHEDAPDGSVTLPDGRVVRNLSDAEYEATYAEPGTTGGHEVPADVLAEAVARAEANRQ